MPARLRTLTERVTRPFRVRLGAFTALVVRRNDAVRRWWQEVGKPLAEPVLERIRGFASFATGVGWGVIIVTLAALVLGWAFAWHELTALAWIGCVILAACVGFLVGPIRYGAALDLTRTRVVVGERAIGAITLSNEGRRSSRPVAVELPVGKGVATFHVPRLEPGETHEDLFTIPTQRRCVLPVGPVSAVRGDPIGLLARVVTWSKPVDLYVHPVTVPLASPMSGVLQDLEGVPSRDLASSDVAFHAIREYVPGDDRRHVHWRSSARMGKLMVRQFEETRRSHLAVALSLAEQDYADEDEMELAISAAGSLGLEALRENKQLTVMVQGASLLTKTGKRFLDSLSGLESVAEDRGGLEPLSLRIGAEVPDASLAVLVSGTAVETSNVRRAILNVPQGIAVLALRCEVGARVAVRPLGSATVLTVGDLRDLPRAMRRVMQP